MRRREPRFLALVFVALSCWRSCWPSRSRARLAPLRRVRRPRAWSRPSVSSTTGARAARGAVQSLSHLCLIASPLPFAPTCPLMSWLVPRAAWPTCSQLVEPRGLARRVLHRRGARSAPVPPPRVVYAAADQRELEADPQQPRRPRRPLRHHHLQGWLHRAVVGALRRKRPHRFRGG